MKIDSCWIPEGLGCLGAPAPDTAFTACSLALNRGLIYNKMDKQNPQVVTQFVPTTPAEPMNFVVHDIAENIPACSSFMSLVRDMVMLRNLLKQHTWFHVLELCARHNGPSTMTWLLHYFQLECSIYFEFLEHLTSNEKGVAGCKAYDLSEFPLI